MKLKSKTEPKTIGMILFLATLIPGAVVMCHQLDCSMFMQGLSTEAINYISMVFMAEIAVILAYIGFIGSAAFIKSEGISRSFQQEWRKEKVFSDAIGIFILVLFLSLAVMIVYTGVVEPVQNIGM